MAEPVLIGEVVDEVLDRVVATLVASAERDLGPEKAAYIDEILRDAAAGDWGPVG